MHPKSQTLMEVHIFMGKKGRFCICCFCCRLSAFPVPCPYTADCCSLFFHCHYPVDNRTIAAADNYARRCKIQLADV